MDNYHLHVMSKSKIGCVDKPTEVDHMCDSLDSLVENISNQLSYNTAITNTVHQSKHVSPTARSTEPRRPKSQCNLLEREYMIGSKPQYPDSPKQMAVNEESLTKHYVSDQLTGKACHESYDENEIDSILSLWAQCSQSSHDEYSLSEHRDCDGSLFSKSAKSVDSSIANNCPSIGKGDKGVRFHRVISDDSLSTISSGN